MPKKLDKDVIANILESSNENDDFSNGSSDNYEPSYSEVSSAHEKDMDDSNEEDAENILAVTRSTADSAGEEFVPIKTITSYRLPDIAHSFETDNPYNIFMKVFPESLFMRITQCTNERIEIMRNSKPAYKNIKLTDTGEIKIIFGCMIIVCHITICHL